MLNNFKSSELKSVYRFLIGSTVLVAILVFMHPLIPHKELSLIPYNALKYNLFYDAQHGGTTQGIWKDKTKASFHCTVPPGKKWNYCGFYIELGSTDASRDFSGYHDLIAKVNYTGPGKGLRFTFRGFVPERSTANEIDTYKLMELHIGKEELDAPFVINKDEWVVSRHWVQTQDIPRQLSQVDFSKILHLSIDLAPPIEVGEYDVTIESVTLRGESIPAETWYLGNVIGWLLANLIVILYRLAKLDKRVLLDLDRINALAGYSDDLKNQSDKYKELSSTDNLTGVLNRNGMLAYIDKQFPDKVIAGRLTLFVFDLDHFKRINDQYGHDIGDIVLKKVSSEIADRVRADDGFCRWGGEEFVLACPDTDEREALLIAEKLRIGISRLKFNNNENVTFSVTASIGFGTAQAGESFDDVFRRVDKALYTAKDLGRNCVNKAA